MNIFEKRQGQMYNELPYFYTETIHNFYPLLKNDDLKTIIIQSWHYLVSQKLVVIYGFVIMPNHLHIIWKMLSSNGKERPSGSFSKFTAHEFRKYLLQNEKSKLNQFIVNKSDRNLQFWKRDPLAILLSSEENLIQKLDYIHNNPIQEQWQLSILPEDYKWSSARFYKDGFDEFGFLTHFKK
jgi:putative transposase